MSAIASRHPSTSLAGDAHRPTAVLVALVLAVSVTAGCGDVGPSHSVDVAPSPAAPGDVTSNDATPRGLTTDELLAQLQDAHASTYDRIDAANALGKLGDALGDHPAVIPALIGALDDADFWVRSSAADALGKLGDPRAVEPLLAAVAVDPAGAMEAASDTGELSAFLHALSALGALGDARAATRLLALASGDAESPVTDSAAAAFDLLGPAVIPALTKAVSSTDSKTALAAITRLGGLGPEAIPALAKAVRNANSKTALAAIAALGGLGEPAVDALVAALGDKRSAIRVAAAEALSGFGGPAVKPLVEALKNKDRALRVAAAESLGQIGDRAATSPLILALADTKVFDAASTALAKIWRDNGTPLVKYLKAKKTVGVYLALIRIGQADTRSALTSALRAFGSVSMAEDYLNCGEATLEKAARDWAAAHGYTVGPSLYAPCIGLQCSGAAWGGG